MAKENNENIILSFLNDKYTDPTLLSFSIEFKSESLLFHDENPVDTSITSQTESLLNAYGEHASSLIWSPCSLLKNLNETKRYNLWKHFIALFPALFKNEQWRVQSIEGLDTVFTKFYDFKDGYTGSGDDKITITCLEDIDLTLYNLFEIYRNCVYDNVYRRQLIPNNLLQFECEITIKDKRNIKYSVEAPNNKLSDPDSIEFQTKYNGIESLAYSTNNHTIKTPKQDASEHSHKYYDRSYNLPTITLAFRKCKFDISQVSKIIENINPGEGDNNFVKYPFSFSYGSVEMKSNKVQSITDWEEVRRLDEDRQSYKASLMERNFQNNILGNKNISIKSGIDGVMTSMQNKGTDFINDNMSKLEDEIIRKGNKILGQEQGYEVGQNIYGQSNFITAFGKEVGDRLSQFADESLGKFKQNTIGKANEFINTQKAKVQGAIANAESSLLNGSKKGSSSSGNKLENIGFKKDSNPTVSKLSGNETVYEEPSSKSSEAFESFNIYENSPSGPKQ